MHRVELLNTKLNSNLYLHWKGLAPQSRGQNKFSIKSVRDTCIYYEGQQGASTLIVPCPCKSLINDKKAFYINSVNKHPNFHNSVFRLLTEYNSHFTRWPNLFKVSFNNIYCKLTHNNFFFF